MIERANLRAIGTGTAYFVAASLATEFTRFQQGGLAFVWMATGILTAALAVTPRHQWRAPIAAAGFASVTITGLFGLGWAIALPIAAINLLEAAIGGYLLKRRRAGGGTLDSLSWFGDFLLAAGFVAPAIGAALGSLTMFLWSGTNVAHNWLTWFVSHSLGNLIIVPFALLSLRGSMSAWAAGMSYARRREAVALLVIFTVCTVYVFGWSRLPLLFLPLGPMMLICFRHDRHLTAIAVCIMAVAGGSLTALGHGPIASVSPDIGQRMQFFQFYLAAGVLTVLPITADLRHRQQMAKAMRESEARYRLLAENSTDILLHISLDGRIMYASPSISRLADHGSGQPIVRNALSLVDEDWRQFVRERHAEVINAKGATVRFEYLASAEEKLRWFETQSRAVLDEDGRPESVVSVVRDIDARKAIELQLAREATSDLLTGLPNRRAFISDFTSRDFSAPLSVAVIDIDHFKRINDQYGHAAGDRALQTFADVARSTIRRNDVVARIGGEEFAIIFDTLSASEAQEICERVRVAVSRTITTYGAQSFSFTISAGVADAIADNPDATLAQADAALYAAKRNGRDQLKLAA